MSKPVSIQTTDHVRDHCLCLHAQQAARLLARRFDAAFRPIGISSGQFSLLHAMNRAEPPPMGPVAALLAMDRTTLTAALKPLERRGLVRIEPNPKDRRGRLLVLTGAGREVLAQAMPVWIAVHAEIEAQIEGGADELRSGLRGLG
jgi:DNA-binding MarR family transcriptional regulator